MSRGNWTGNCSMLNIDALHSCFYENWNGIQIKIFSELFSFFLLKKMQPIQYNNLPCIIHWHVSLSLVTRTWSAIQVYIHDTSFIRLTVMTPQSHELIVHQYSKYLWCLKHPLKQPCLMNWSEELISMIKEVNHVTRQLTETDKRTNKNRACWYSYWVCVKQYRVQYLEYI